MAKSFCDHARWLRSLRTWGPMTLKCFMAGDHAADFDTFTEPVTNVPESVTKRAFLPVRHT